MNKNKFWALIDEVNAEVLGKPDSLDNFKRIMIQKLTAFSTDEIIHWQLIFDLYQKLSAKDTLCAAYYIIENHLSDDGFDYFRPWITAHGKTLFLNALKNPDSLADWNPKRYGTWFEGMLYIAHEAYNAKKGLLGEDRPKYYAELNSHVLSPEEITEIESEIVFADNSTDYWESDFPWENDKDLLKKMLPRLYKMFENYVEKDE